MLWNAKNGCIAIDDTDMDYVTFGYGNRFLVMVPGLGDGLMTVKGMAAAMAYTYRVYAKDYTVFLFSRKNHLEPYLQEGYSTRAMAEDLATAMKKLGVTKADILGVSQGGMIAQYLAIDHPELVDKLILAVTLSRPNQTVQKVIAEWIQYARQGNYKALMTDTAEKSYSEKYLKGYRRLYPLLGRIGRPKDFSRFIIQATSCIQHNAYAELGHIACQTLVIGGEDDRIVTGEASIELADSLKDCELFLYRGLGHAAYEEADDFNRRIMDFLSK